MTYETKKRIVCAALVVLMIWPLVHHVMVGRLDLDPWKLFGWSMYTVPPRRVSTSAFSLDDGRSLGVAGLPAQQAQEAVRAYKDFARLRMQFGHHVAPDEFARALFRAYPEVDRIAIYVQHIRLNRTTAKVGQESFTDTPYTYQRRETFD